MLRTLALALVLAAAVAADAAACSCPARDAGDRLRDADAAWAGHVVERRVLDEGDPSLGGDERLLYTFAVDRVYKGDVLRHRRRPRGPPRVRPRRRGPALDRRHLRHGRPGRARARGGPLARARRGTRSVCPGGAVALLAGPAAVVAVAGASLRVDSGAVAAIHRGRFDDAVLGRRRAVLLRDGARRSRVTVVVYGDRARTVAPRPGEAFLFAADPDRGRVAFGATTTYGAAPVATLHDLRTGAARPLPLPGRHVGGVGAAFLRDGRLAVFPGRRGGTDLLDARLRRLGRVGYAFQRPPLLAAGALYADDAEDRLVRVAPDGSVTKLAHLPHVDAAPLVALPRDRDVRAQPRASQARTSPPCSSRRGGPRRTAGR